MRNAHKAWHEVSIPQWFTAIIPPSNSGKNGVEGGDTFHGDISDWSSLVLFCSGSKGHLPGCALTGDSQQIPDAGRQQRV